MAALLAVATAAVIALPAVATAAVVAFSAAIVAPSRQLCLL